MWATFASPKQLRTSAPQLFPLAQAYMKRLSLAELKEQSAQTVSNNLEAVKGGVVGDCHSWLDQFAEGLRIYNDPVYGADMRGGLSMPYHPTLNPW